MTRYLYYIQRNSINNKPIRELKCTEDYIIINNKQIDNINNIGIKIKYNKEELIQYIGKIEGQDFKDFQTRLQSIVESKGLCCKYTYNNQQYLAIPSPRKRQGVWHENDLIVHQVGITSPPHEYENVFLGNALKKEELKDFTDEDYFGLWEDLLTKLTGRGENIYRAMFISFALAYTKYYNDRAKIKYSYGIYFYHLCFFRGVDELSIVKHLTRQQFNYYILPALNGRIEAVQPDMSIYTPLSGDQIHKAYKFYVQQFWNWHNRSKN